MKTSFRTPMQLGLLLLSLVGMIPLGVLAQDSFGGSRPAPRQQAAPTMPQGQPHLPQTMPVTGAQPGYGGPAPQGQGATFEAQDFGVAPTANLRPSNQLGGPTPTSIPGGKVIATQQLAQLLQQQQGRVLLLHAYGGMQHLPGAIPVVPASQGGSFDDQVQREFGQYLYQATGGDATRTLVFYCGGVQCWGSYNAALRAIRMGFRDVHWYRGGIEAWGQSGLPVLTAEAQGNGQAR